MPASENDSDPADDRASPPLPESSPETPVAAPPSSPFSLGDDDLAGPGQFVADQRSDHPDSIHLVDGGNPDEAVEDSKSKLKRCERILNYEFRDQTLLQSALTHASGAANRLASNERLEFLGDAILGMTVCEWLFDEYPEYTEGDLTKIKSAVVSRRSCGRTACKLGLDECLIVGRGVTRNRSYPRSLVSDVFESVIAALYLDGGADLVRDRLKQWLKDEVRLAVDTQGSGNHKSVLQQYAQRELSATPIYKLVRESGPDHRKAFLIGAVIGTDVFPPAWGNNKKDAEQRAAANALATLHKQPAPHSSLESTSSE